MESGPLTPQTDAERTVCRHTGLVRGSDGDGQHLSLRREGLSGRGTEGGSGERNRLKTPLAKEQGTLWGADVSEKA